MRRADRGGAPVPGTGDGGAGALASVVRPGERGSAVQAVDLAAGTDVLYAGGCCTRYAGGLPRAPAAIAAPVTHLTVS